jgi:non-ribosomal peptide synthetase component F
VPHALAVLEGTLETSYRSLVEAGHGFAAELRRLGAGKRTRVGVCADPSARLFAVILGIWAVGATYVPLDPSLPQRRLEYLIADAGLALVLGDAKFAELFSSLTLHSIDELPALASAGPLPSEAAPDDVAYIVYTSGTTGMPKGVEIRHAASRTPFCRQTNIARLDVRIGRCIEPRSRSTSPSTTFSVPSLPAQRL